LSTVYGIVRQHGGHINVYSEPTVGTTFKIYLPLVGEAAEEHAPADQDFDLRGTETILVVDDESYVRRLVADTLRPLGFKVLEASSAQEALQNSATTREAIDLLLTDIVMPGMNGIELARRICESRPAITVIFASGYTNGTVFSGAMLEENANFLQKPITPKKLIGKLKSIGLNVDDRRRAQVLGLMLACAVLCCGCAAAKQLYPGTALPRDQVATLRGIPFFQYRDGGPGKGNTPAANGGLILIGLDGAAFAKPVPSAYEGQQFALLPGEHVLEGYFQYKAIEKGHATYFYSDRFQMNFVAQAGCEYTYEADFFSGRVDEGQRGGKSSWPCRIRVYTESRSCSGARPQGEVPRCRDAPGILGDPVKTAPASTPSRGRRR
jgi:CheY-like chemotaxis protein